MSTVTAPKTWTKQEIRLALENNNAWIIRGISAIYAYQTASEQDAQQTEDRNDVGFNSADSEILSSFAEQITAWNNTPARDRRYDSPLSPKQIQLARRRMKKYAGQLARIANGENGRRPD